VTRALATQARWLRALPGARVLHQARRRAARLRVR
jgi:hypothetical protein